jgi:hypothetical protein
LLRPVTKIMSVMPAATASSTAYWISGLSTMGIISFGLALVAGRKRVPRPATGNTALLTFFMPVKFLQQLPELNLVEYGDAQGPRLFQLGAGFGAGHHVIGLLRHGTGHLAALRLNHVLGASSRVSVGRCR